MRTASPAGSAARSAGVGQRWSHAVQAGRTRATGVCCSITSLTNTGHACVPGSRQGRSRAACAYHSETVRASWSDMSVASWHAALCARRRGALESSSYGVRVMFRPVGDLPPSVYWRRRFALLGSVVALVVLLALSIGVLTSSSGTAAESGAGAGTSSAASATPPGAVSSTPMTSTSPAQGASSSPTVTGSTSRSASGSSSAPAATCVATQLSLAALSDKTTYAVGDQPVVSILVKNTSSQ